MFHLCFVTTATHILFTIQNNNNNNTKQTYITIFFKYIHTKPNQLAYYYHNSIMCLLLMFVHLVGWYIYSVFVCTHTCCWYKMFNAVNINIFNS